jgi:hypothetical protein
MLSSSADPYDACHRGDAHLADLPDLRRQIPGPLGLDATL